METIPEDTFAANYAVVRKIIEGRLTSLILVKTLRGLPEFLIFTPLDMTLGEDQNGMGTSNIKIYGRNQTSDTNRALYLWFQPNEGETIKTNILKTGKIRQAIKQLKHGKSACIKFEREEAILMRGANLNEEIVIRQVNRPEELLTTN